MADKKEKKVKASIPSSSRKIKTSHGFTRTIPEPHLRGTVSVAKIVRAVKNLMARDPAKSTSETR